MKTVFSSISWVTIVIIFKIQVVSYYLRPLGFMPTFQRWTRELIFGREPSNEIRASNPSRNLIPTDLETILASCRSVHFEGANNKRLQRIDICIELFEAIPKLGYQPNLFSFNYLIWSYSNVGDIKKALLAFRKLLTKFTPNVYSYGALMHGFAKAKDPSGALQLLEEMESQQMVPNKILFTSAIASCSQSKDYQTLMKILLLMERYQIQPDTIMLNSIINVCCLAGKFPEVEYYVNKLKQTNAMDMITYHTLMSAYFQRGRYEMVLQLYRQATSENIQFDSGIYAVAINAAMQLQQFNTILKMARDADRQQILLTPQTYTLLIKAYYELGGVDQALSLLDVMKAKGIIANEYSYSAVIAACRSRPAHVIALLQQMKAEKISPNEVVLSAAISSLVASGNPNYTNYAFALYQDMETSGPTPNLFTYNALIQLFAQSGQLAKALEIFGVILKKGLAPNYHTYTSLIVACGNTNRTDVIESILAMMKEQELSPDLISYSAIFEAYRKTVNLTASLRLLQEMWRQQIIPEQVHYNIIMKTFKATGRVDELWLFLQKIWKKSQSKSLSLKEEFDFSVTTFDIILQTFLEAQRWKEVLWIMEVMLPIYSIKPSMKTCVALIDLLEKQRQYPLVFKVYRSMIRDGYDFYENRLLNDVFKRLIQVTGIANQRERSISMFENEKSVTNRTVLRSSEQKQRVIDDIIMREDFNASI